MSLTCHASRLGQFHVRKSKALSCIDLDWLPESCTGPLDTSCVLKEEHRGPAWRELAGTALPLVDDDEGH